MTIAELQEQRTTLVAYLFSKWKAADWHGCADAAMDLREIDAKLEVLNEPILGLNSNGKQAVAGRNG